MPTPRRVMAAALAAVTLVPFALSADAAERPPAAAPPQISPALAAQLEGASPTSPLRVMVNGVDVDEATAAAEAAGLTVLTTFDRIGVAVAAGTADQVRAVARRTDARLETIEWADQPLTLDQSTSHDATRATQAAQIFETPANLPYDGTGVGILVLDSGVDGTHPMFRLPDGSSKVKRNLEALPLAVEPFVMQVSDDLDGDNNTDDLGGHGTHVASIAAGVAVTTGRGNDIVGSAPGADLYAISASTAGSSLYGLTAAGYWAVENHDQPCGPNRPDCAPIRVVNNSWGGSEGEEFSANDITVQIQRALLADGVVVVRSSGNNGGDGSRSTITGGYKIDPRPGVITVANYDDANTGTREGTINSGSSRGDTTKTNTWPDISAPGTQVDGACRAHHAHCSFLFSPVEADADYGELTGTSMSAPHVAGYVALLLQADPTLTPREVEYVLEDTAHQFAVDGGYTSIPKDFEGNDNLTSQSHHAAGHGLVDIAAALAEVLDETDPGYAGPCGTLTVIDDPEGDAAVAAGLTEPNIGEGMPTPDVDIVGLTATEVGNRIRFAIEVADLGETPLGNGDAVRSFFNVGAIEFTLDMSRQATAQYQARGSLSRPDPNDPTGVQNIVVDNTFPVAFDHVNDVAYADLDATILGDGSPVGAGDTLSQLRSLWRRSLGALAVPADEAASDCALTIG